MLGPQLSSTVLRRLPEAYAKKLASSISNLPPPDPAAMPDFFKDIAQFMQADHSRRPAEAPAKEEVMKKELEKQVPAAPVIILKPEDIHGISDLTPAMLWEVLGQEKPQTVAFFMRYLMEDLREALKKVIPKEKLGSLEQSMVFDHELAKAVFADLSNYIVQAWKDKLSPDKTSVPALAS
jgi:flagellar motor switch protein FliG